MNFRKILTYGLGIGALTTAAALIGLFTPIKGEGNVAATCADRICVARFDYHSMLIIPAENRLFSWRDKGIDRSTQYLGIGWGERDWYVNPPDSADKLLQALRTLLLPNSAVIKIQQYENFPSHYQTECIGITPEHYLNLMSFIQQTFQKDAQNDVVAVAEDTKLNATYYEAKGTYFLFNNSNHWTATGLRIAGADTPLWAAHAIAIMQILQPTCPPPSAML